MLPSRQGRVVTMLSMTRYRLGSLIALVAAVLTIAFPAIAHAWSSAYVGTQAFSPGGIGLSAFNSGMNYNFMSWNSEYYGGSNLRGQVTLCDSSYQCYSYSYTNSGTVSDTRSISYGRAKCNSWQDNFYDMLVYQCYADNEH